MKNCHTWEELASVNRTHFEYTVSHPNEHPTRLSSSREPVPEKSLAHFKALELRVGEVLHDSFLQ
jgi:hypothetical protein